MAIQIDIQGLSMALEQSEKVACPCFMPEQ